jgi:hypothetical protein
VVLGTGVVVALPVPGVTVPVLGVVVTVSVVVFEGDTTGVTVFVRVTDGTRVRIGRGVRISTFGPVIGRRDMSIWGPSSTKVGCAYVEAAGVRNVKTVAAARPVVSASPRRTSEP